LWLKLLGAEITGISLRPHTTLSFFDDLGIKNDINHHLIDIRKIDKINEIILHAKPDIVFHLAAQAIVRESYKDPINTITTNVVGTTNILQSIRNSKIKACIVYTSDKCYKHVENKKAFIETDCLGGNDPYSASKACAEILTESYRNSFFNKKNSPNIATVRAGNVIGGGDWSEDRLIPDFIRAIIKNQTMKVRYPNHIRPWQYVLEPIAGCLWLAKKISENRSFSEAWNFGPSVNTQQYTVRKLVEEFCVRWKTKNAIIKMDKNKKLHEEKFLLINPTKAEKILGIKSVYSIQKTINETIDWYKNFIDKKYPIKEFSIKQIKIFEENAMKKKLTWTK